MICPGNRGASGEFLLTAGTALAIQMSRQLTVEEMELVAAFLEVLGDQLALLALKMPQDGAPGCDGA